jgi:hypothetical protein
VALLARRAAQLLPGHRGIPGAVRVARDGRSLSNARGQGRGIARPSLHKETRMTTAIIVALVLLALVESVHHHSNMPAR